MDDTRYIYLKKNEYFDLRYGLQVMEKGKRLEYLRKRFNINPIFVAYPRNCILIVCSDGSFTLIFPKTKFWRW